MAVIFFMSALFADAQQSLTAVDDHATTGPMQKVRVNVLANDILTCSDYTLNVLTTLDPTVQGTATVESGGFIEFSPSLACRGTTVTIIYGLTCNGVQVTANLVIDVSLYNRPVNIIDPTLECYEEMETDITFGIHKKYSTTITGSGDNYIDGYQLPLVGDLNGDGKPEIVAMGVNSLGTGYDIRTRYINIYDGQTGARLVQYDYTTAMNVSGYHRPPAMLALADLDNDGYGEIVMAHDGGNVMAYKLDLNASGAITNIHLWWTGRDQNNAIVSHKAPVSSSSDYDHAMPYIADLDGDGIPEVIVYNKIFHGATGRLIMSWLGASENYTQSCYSTSTNGCGLNAENYSSPLSSDNAIELRGRPMIGRRPGSSTYSSHFIAVPAIADIDGDGQQEIITGSYIYKFNISDKSDHRNNSYRTIHGPLTATVHENLTNNTATTTYNFSDGFTRVADIDGDGNLDIIVAVFGNDGGTNCKIVVYVWDMNDLNNVKACVSFRGNGGDGANFSVPFIGDINGKPDGWDGAGWTRKLPEICLVTGAVWIDRNSTGINTTNNTQRTGIKFHPLTDEKIRRGAIDGTSSSDNTTNAPGWNSNNVSNNYRRFNINRSNSMEGHIIGLTWDASASAIEDKLKLSWGMEHDDNSCNTGITLFDFDNNNTADLCYRDEATLRVISPARAGNDYVVVTETETTSGSAVMFSTSCRTGTGFEAPIIADVNMDASADIIVTNSNSSSASRAWIDVFEYVGAKWAPAPPVWNQGMYDPTQVREDLKINARPIPMLTPYVKNGETIYPYNGSWMQVPIVRDGENYVPVVRYPDAVLQNVEVIVFSSPSPGATVTLEIFNNGTATLADNTPISFYNGGVTGLTIEQGATLISTQNLGVDLFPNEKVTKTFTVNGSLNNCLIWVRVMANTAGFPPPEFDDCDLSNNTFAGIDCPYLSYSIQASSTVICGVNGVVTLKAIPGETPHYAPTYQWYRNEMVIPGETNQIYFATEPGTYKCYVTEDICREYSSSVTITKDFNLGLPVPDVTTQPSDGKLCVGGTVLLHVNNFNQYSGASYIWVKDGMPFDTASVYYISVPHVKIPSGQEEGNYQVYVVKDGCGVLSLKDSIWRSTDEAAVPVISKTPADAVICGDNGSVLLQITNLNEMTGSSFQWYKDGSPIQSETDFYYFATA
ncbi:MAG: hypothetical protein LBC68_14995, partial [Prevotellaceae bacterium]|nr:hypothetical protein [Prevotellaceae bacterium]